MRTVALDLKQFGISAVSARYIQEERHFTGELLHQFKAYLACERQQPYVVEFPASWFQYLKQSLPAWVWKRWPVKMRRIELKVETVYPYLRTSLPLEVCGPRVMVVVQDQLIGAFLPEANGLMPGQWVEKAHEMRSDPKLFHVLFTEADKCPCCKRAWVHRP